MLRPVFLVMSARNGSQMVFRLAVVSVEMIPKLTSSAAAAGAAASISAIDALISVRSISSLLACLGWSSHVLLAESLLGSGCGCTHAGAAAAPRQLASAAS